MGKFEVTPIVDSDGLLTYMREHCPRIPPSDIWISPPKVAMPSVFLKDMERIQNMEVRKDDTWVITFPKCGTTWTQEMVWLLGNKCDIEKAKTIPQVERFPFVELHSIGVPRDLSRPSTLEQAETMKSPRFLKSHLPLALLPHQLWTVKPKIIYTCRNPQATALSYFHHFQIFNSYNGDLEHFLDAFLNDIVDYGPFWTHILDFWKLRNEPNVFFNFYEDMKDDLGSVLKSIGHFLGTEDLNEEKIAALKEHLSFKSMKENPMVNLEFVIQNIFDKNPKEYAFIRKGEKDEWKTAISPEYHNKFKEWSDKWKSETDFTKY